MLTNRSDSVRQYIDNHLFWDLFGVLPKADLYQDYRVKCIASGVVPVSINKFGRDLKRFFPSIVDHRPTLDGVRVRCWLGASYRA